MVNPGVESPNCFRILVTLGEGTGGGLPKLPKLPRVTIGKLDLVIG